MNERALSRSPSPAGCWIVGTDTDVGKTTVTAALLRALRDAGVAARAVKPVQTGCGRGVAGLIAPDVTRYIEAAGDTGSHALRMFEPACSPHLAAHLAGERLDVHVLAQEITRAMTSDLSFARADFTLVEGAGGLHVPLNDRETLLDLVACLRLPVLLVAANRLGCLNHVLLSLEALRVRGLAVAGVVLTRIRPDGSLSHESPSSSTLSAEALLDDNAAFLNRVRQRYDLPVVVNLPYVAALAVPATQEQGFGVLAEELRGLAQGLVLSQRSVSEASSAALLDFDREHLWHPYTSITQPLPVHEAVSVQGVRIRLRDGRELIDGMASWWCAIHGYGHPALRAALHQQAERMAHVMFSGLTHAPVVTLAQKVLPLLPPGLEHLFLADSGSVAVEVALKMALQYWQSLGQSQKHRVLALRGGYHGDTLGAMSVCDPVTGMHTLFADVLPTQLFVERPSCTFGAGRETLFDPACLAPMEAALKTHGPTLAAVILEPVVQGAGGMYFYHPDYLKGVSRLCREYDVLFIADEIATGFGRTGKLFACEWAGVTPDLLCLGKALTGGIMTLAATAATKRVAFGIGQGSPKAGGGVFMHGPTFMGNPLACAVACSSIDLLLQSPWRARVNALEQGLLAGLAPCRGLPGVTEVRVLGAIGVVEMAKPVNVPALQAFFVEQGVWIRPFGRAIYLMPPYIMDASDLRRLTTAVCAAVARLGA